MDHMYVCAVFLVCLCQLQGSSAVTPVFVQKGNDVLLNVTKADALQDVFTVVWNFNKTDVLVTFSPGREPTVSPAYTGRVEFSVNDYSLKVKNLQEADSGVYTARVTSPTKEQTTEYNVTIQDSGPPHNDINVIVIVIVLVTIAVLCIIAVSAVCYRRKRRKYKRENTGNKVYADPVMETVAQPPNPTNDASDSSTMYSLVGTHTGPTETRVDPLPDSLYAEVENTARS